MTLTELAQELLRASNESLDDSDGLLVTEQWIRDALDEYALETNWRAFVTSSSLPTVATSRVYTLPINVRDVRYIRIPASEKIIEYIEKERLAEFSQDLERIGTPDFWYYEDEAAIVPPNVTYRIGFQPVPDAIYPLDVQYNIVPARLLSMDTIPLQNDAILPLKFLVRAYMAFDDEDFDKADRLYQRYAGAVDKLLRRENNNFAKKGRFQQRDIPTRASDRKYARLNPDHF